MISWVISGAIARLVAQLSGLDDSGYGTPYARPRPSAPTRACQCTRASGMTWRVVCGCAAAERCSHWPRACSCMRQWGQRRRAARRSATLRCSLAPRCQSAAPRQREAAAAAQGHARRAPGLAEPAQVPLDPGLAATALGVITARALRSYNAVINAGPGAVGIAARQAAPPQRHAPVLACKLGNVARRK